MSLLSNPILIGKLTKDYFTDIKRLEKYNYNKLMKYRDKVFRKIVNYAYTVPFYSDLCKNIGVSKNDIKNINDIQKLPIINRQNIIKNYPDRTINPKLRKKSTLINTSGSTRSPVTLYTDQYTLLKGIMAHIRELRYYGVKWNKSRISVIANFYSQTTPTQTLDSINIPFLKPFFKMDNIQQLNADDNLKEMIKKVDDFKPDFIVGFPGPLRHFAILREKGYGLNIKPKGIIFAGGLLDDYEKKHISEIFDTRLYDVYGSTEAGPISFECKEGNLHINSDFVYLEVIDKNGKPLPKGKTGKLAITRLFGRGTPLIRYTGMGDILTLEDNICNCGLQTDSIKKIHGRIKESIVLPNEKIIFPNVLSNIPGQVLEKLNTAKIDRIQLIQETIDKIEVWVIIDEETRDIGPTVEELFNELKSAYQKLFGPDVEVKIKEVAKLKSEENNPESTPGILSKINPNKYI